MNSDLEAAFEKMASACARDLIKNGDLLGLGSGSAVARFAQALGRRVRAESLKVSVVPSSMQSWLLASENGLPISPEASYCPQSIDVVVDGADQVGLESRSMIKGGGGALLKEKILMSSAERSFILGDESKFVRRLSRTVPVEIVQFSMLSAEKKLIERLRAKSTLRKLDKGYPYYTESGNVILDCQFGPEISDPLTFEKRVKEIPGVVECGIFNLPVERFYKANKDGSFELL